MEYNSFEAVWGKLCQLQGRKFKTKRGLPFTFAVKSGTAVWVQRDGKTVNQALPKSNFEQVRRYMQEGLVHDIADINRIAKKRGESQVRGASYVWAILDDGRVIP